jgi:hypothetical protein
MSEDIYSKSEVKGRTVYMDSRFDTDLITSIIWSFIHSNERNDGYLQFGKVQFAEELDALIYPKYSTVNVEVEHNDWGGKYIIRVHWDESKKLDITEDVHNVLRGLSI